MDRNYDLVDDPALPCPYCCGWKDYPDEPWRSWPYDIDGSRLPALYDGIHEECQQAVDAYEAEIEEERRHGGPW